MESLNLTIGVRVHHIGQNPKNVLTRLSGCHIIDLDPWKNVSTFLLLSGVRNVKMVVEYLARHVLPVTSWAMQIALCLANICLIEKVHFVPKVFFIQIIILANVFHPEFVR